jgi:hypothetical protein
MVSVIHVFYLLDQVLVEEKHGWVVPMPYRLVDATDAVRLNVAVLFHPHTSDERIFHFAISKI